MNRLQSMPLSRPRLVLALLLALLLAACGDKPDAMLASARDYLAKNDVKAAIIQLKNALQESPELPEARFLLGQALLRTGDAAGAETELRKALGFKHPPELVVPPLAQAMLLQGQFKKVTDEFSGTALGQPQAKANLQTSLAVAYGAQGNQDLSKAALEAALAADPAYVPARLAQARQQANAGQLDVALASLESILAKTPASHEAWKLKGDILQVARKPPEEALIAYRKALEAKPDYLDAHVQIVTLLLRQAQFDEASRQMDLLRKAAPNRYPTRYLDTMLAYQKKDLKRARELAQQLLKAGPDNPMGLQLAGAIEFQLNSLVQAEAYLAKAVQAVPGAILPRRLLVSTYLRSGQPAKALTTLLPALKGDKLEGATNTLAGEVYLQNGDAKKAQEYFTKAARQDPKNTRARTVLALTHLAGGQEESALVELQEIAASDASPTTDLALISALLSRRQFDRALKAIDALEKKQPDKPLASSLRGRTLLAKQDAAGARRSFERSVALDATYFPSVASLAALDLADKKPDDARKRFEAVLAKDPKHPQALLALAELRARTGGTREQVAELVTRAITANPGDKAPRLLLVELHLRGKDYKQALSAAQTAVSAVPDSPELLDALGRAQLASGDGNQAILTFNKVAAMQPQSPLPQLRIAEAHMAAKDKDAAAASLRKALDIKPDALEAQRGLILLALDKKNYDQAVTIARTIQKQHPKSPIGYQYEGDIAVAQKKWDLAADAYRAGLKQVPAPDLAVKAHGALSAAGKSAELDKFTTAWLRDNPKDLAFRLYLGDFGTLRKDYAGAEKMYNSVLQIQPNNAIALNNLAWVSGKLDRDGAIGYAEKAIALVPNQPAYQDTLAMLLSEKNQYAKAVELQNRVVALQPSNGTYRLNLARIHIKGGQKELARKELETLAKLGDKFAGQAEVASLMKSL